VDAIVPSNAVNHVLASPLDAGAFGTKNGNSLPEEGQGWRPLDWVVDDAMLAEIEQCQARNKGIVEDSDNSNLFWREFATEWIKQNGVSSSYIRVIERADRLAKVSPDSFIQQALQLAWYKDQEYASATYESASTRGFLHGRTETIRSVTTDSRAFVKAMLDTKFDVSPFSC
jgi:carnitine O-acetyltransferase